MWLQRKILSIPKRSQSSLEVLRFFSSKLPVSVTEKKPLSWDMLSLWWLKLCWLCYTGWLALVQYSIAVLFQHRCVVLKAVVVNSTFCHHLKPKMGEFHWLGLTDVYFCRSESLDIINSLPQRLSPCASPIQWQVRCCCLSALYVLMQNCSSQGCEFEL